MAASTGYILAAAAVTMANEAIFAPLARGDQTGTLKSINWRIVPATAVAVITLAGLEQISEPLGTGLAVLALIVAIVVPFGNAPSPIDNASKVLGLNK